MAKAFAESQIYRIDHYLGKETVQNMMVLRFANSIFEPLWNSKFVDHVQITVAEEEGVGSRVGYYDGVGALRDMVQNHLLQVLCLVAMEPPWSLKRRSHSRRQDGSSQLLEALEPRGRGAVDHSGTVHLRRDTRRTGSGLSPGGQRFLRERNKPIPPDSTTETFVAMRVFIDNWRWEGVPFYLRTGKRLPKRSSEVAIQFKEVPKILFNAHPDVPLEPDVLSIRLAPEESMSLRIASKLPGPKVRIYPVKMEFNYNTSFGGKSPEAYERLILDVMAGDATLFMRRDAVETAWAWVMPILDAWAGTARALFAGVSSGNVGPRRSGANDDRGSAPMEDVMSSTASTTPVIVAPLADIEFELSRRLREANNRGRRAPTLTARLSNLVIFCQSNSQAKTRRRRFLRSSLCIRHACCCL